MINHIVNRGADYIKNNKRVLLYTLVLLILLPVTVIFAGQTQNSNSKASAVPLAIDKQAAKNQDSAASTIVSPAFTTTAPNELVVVFLASDGPLGSSQSFSSVTGGGLNFTLARRANTQKGTAEVWYAYSSGILTNVSFTATRQTGSYQGMMRVITFKGARNVLGSVSGATGATGLPSTSFLTTVDGSMVFGVGNDPTQSLKRTPGNNQTIMQQYLVSKSKSSFWVQRQNNVIAAAGTTATINDLAPPKDAWNLVAVEVIPVASSTTLPPVGNASGLVASYAFGEGSGTTTADSSGNGNTATVTSASWVVGKYGSGLSFNGLKSSLTSNSSASVDIAGSALTISMWLNPQPTGEDTVLLGKFWNATMTSPFYQYGIELQNGGRVPVLQIGTPTGVKTASMGTPVVVNEWSHLAVTFNGTEAKFYSNGNLVQTAPLVVTITPRGNQLQIGSDISGSQFYKGLLDEVRIYKTTLSQSEVLADMNNAIVGSTNAQVIVPTVGVTATPTIRPATPTPTITAQAPATAGFPNENNTGVPAGKSLSAYAGPTNITTSNTVIDSKIVSDCLSIHAPGVIIRNSKISADCFYVVFSSTDYTGAPLLIEDSEIDCKNTRGTAIGDTNITVRRSDISKCENGFDLDGDIIVTDSYIHDLTQGSELHTDGMQITPVGHNITIRHNTIYAFTYSENGTSAIISPDVSKGIVSNILIENNLFAGGSYTVYCQQHGKGNNYRVINNHFSTIYSSKVGAYAPSTDCDDEAQVTGNVYHETGQPVRMD